MAERKPNPRRSLFSEAVKKHSSGDQAPVSQDIDLSQVDLTQNNELTEAQQRAEESKGDNQPVDLSDVDLTPTTRAPRGPRGGARKSREQLQAELTASELDAQKYLRADRKAKVIRGRKAFQPGAGFYKTVAADPSEAGKMLAGVKEGKNILQPITATNAYSHVKDIHEELKTFINNLPSILRAKAKAHDAAADELSEAYPDHPEVASHRYEAAQIRSFLGEGPSARDNLREIRDSNESVSLGTPRSLERVLTPIKNRLVEAQAKVATIPITGKEEAAGLGVKGQLSPNNKRTHLSIKSAHTYLVNLHRDINELVRPLGIGTETGPAALELKRQRIDNIVDKTKPSKPDVSKYQDARDDFEPGAAGRMSKPGHIWGDHETIAGKRTGNREQIPISKESLEMLRNRTSASAQIHITRMRSIINSGQSPEEKAAAAQEDRDTSLYAYSPEAEEANKEKARAAGRLRTSKDGEEYEVAQGATPKTTKRDGNTVRVVSTDPKKNTTVGTYKGAVQQVAADRSQVSETERHIKIAVRSLIDDTPIPAETMAHIESLPNKNKEQDKISETIIARHQEHQTAVAEAIKSIRTTGKMTRQHRDIFKREGTNPVDIVKLARAKKGA